MKNALKDPNFVLANDKKNMSNNFASGRWGLRRTVTALY